MLLTSTQLERGSSSIPTTHLLPELLVLTASYLHLDCILTTFMLACRHSHLISLSISYICIVTHIHIQRQTPCPHCGHSWILIIWFLVNSRGLDDAHETTAHLLRMWDWRDLRDPLRQVAWYTQHCLAHSSRLSPCSTLCDSNWNLPELLRVSPSLLGHSISHFNGGFLFSLLKGWKPLRCGLCTGGGKCPQQKDQRSVLSVGLSSNEEHTQGAWCQGLWVTTEESKWRDSFLKLGTASDARELFC